jgi:hypothetical protein
MRVTVEHVERIAADADAVWPFFRWDNLEAMQPGGFFLGVRYRERRAMPGAIRIVTLASGARLIERLDAQDSIGRRLHYSILDTGGVPVADYRGEVVVSACGPGMCFVRFACACTPVGISEVEWRDMWTPMQVANAAFIRERVVTATPSG